MTIIRRLSHYVNAFIWIFSNNGHEKTISYRLTVLMVLIFFVTGKAQLHHNLLGMVAEAPAE
ncbi:hypothetical protein D3C74_431140 [compost metagenome]